MARKATTTGANGEVIVLPGKLATTSTAQLPGRQSGAGARIPRDIDPSTLNPTTASFRAMTDAVSLLRTMADQEGAFSFAVFSYVEAAMSDYTVTAYNAQTNQFDPAGTQLALQIINQIDTLHDYRIGFSDKRGIPLLLETGLRDVMLSGGVAMELVLNKARLPDKVYTLAYEKLKWIVAPDAVRVYPQQQASTGLIDLDIPNFFIGEIGKGSDKAYTASPMLAAIKQIFYYGEFVEDMRRAVRRAGHTRLVFKLDYEKVKASAPQDVRQDPVKLKKYLDTIQADFATALKSLNPEDALVVYDFAEADGISAAGEKADYQAIMEAIQSLVATSLKTHPSILGLRLGGSQSLSNTESLIFIKGARALQRPVQLTMSRLLTLSTRLYGADIYVKFAFKPIDLRPESELEAFRTMRQQRVLQALSLGWMTDDEAAHELGYGPRAPGAPTLSGTMFLDNNAALSSAMKASPNSDPQGRALQPSTPSKAGGASQ